MLLFRLISSIRQAPTLRTASMAKNKALHLPRARLAGSSHGDCSNVRDRMEAQAIVRPRFCSFRCCVGAQDWQEAYAFTSPEFRRVTPFEEFVAQQELLIRSFGTLKSVEQGGTVVESKGKAGRWTAAVDAKLHFERSTTLIVFAFHLEDGDWKLFGFEQR